MKKIILSIFSVILLFSCSDTGIEVISYSDYSSDISYQVGSPRDKRLTFFDINEFKQIRSIPNNLSTGSLSGRVQFAQTHTIDPNNNEARKEPSLIPYRAALLLFTPQEELYELSVKVSNGKNTSVFKMVPPVNMPKSDYMDRSGTKPDITYSKRSWSVQLPYDYVTPEMQLDFTGKTTSQVELSGTLFGNDIEFAAPIEGAFLVVRLGMLTDNVATGQHSTSQAMTYDIAHGMQEYFQTVPFARLFHGYYEDRVLKKVIINNGKIYENKSDYVGADYYSGDMRENVAKAQVSVGIDLANKGVASSPLDQSHQLGNDMFYFTVHHAKGRYTNGEGKPVDVPHGLSGGNGIGTLVDSTGNEFSHEVGHGYGMGHYPFLNDASDGSVHGYTTSWGYDAYKNRMRANVAWNSTPQAVMYQDKWYITPFQNYYGWNRDCMAGGVADSAISRYTHNTARSTRQVQKNIENRYFLSDDKNNNGEYYYISWDKESRTYKKVTDEKFLNSRISPTRKGVPVITILGGYDPTPPHNAVIYQYFRGNWGNVFDSIFQDSPAEATSYLEITYYDNKPKKYVVLSDKRYNAKIINKLHVNIAEEDKPKSITLYVNKVNKGSTTIKETVYDKPLLKAVEIGKANGYQDVIDNDTIFLNDSLANKSIDNYILSAKEKELIEIFARYKALNKLDANPKKIADDYIAKKNKADNINMFIDNNYISLENNDISADEALKKLFAENGLGSVIFKFNQAELNGKCMEVYQSETSSYAVRLSSKCNESKEQRWAIDKSGRIHSALYPGYCLDMKNMSVLQLCSDDTSQQWKIRNPESIANGVFYENMGTAGKCIDNSGGNSDKIISYNCTNGNNQKFKNKITEDENLYLSLFGGSLIEEIWKYIPAEKVEIK